MIVFLSLCYCGFIWLIFMKLKLLPFNRGAKVTVVTIGVVAIFSLLTAMNLCQPYATNAQVTVLTTPIIPRVTGRVIEVAVEANIPLAKGDVLFKIDPAPFQAEVDRIAAALAEAEQAVPQLKQAHDAAKAAVERTTAQRDMAKIEYERETKLRADEMAAEIEYDRSRTAWLSSTAALLEAEARAEQTRLAYRSEIDGENTTVARIRAELAAARIDLDECTVYAPADGYVSSFFLQPGAIATAASLAPVMTFVYAGDPIVTATISANVQRYINADDPTELTLDTNPGLILKAKVVDIIPATGEGALTPSGALVNTGNMPQKGRVLVRIGIDDDLAHLRLPAGTGGAVAIYTEKGNIISIVRRVIIRMYAWMNYLPGA